MLHASIIIKELCIIGMSQENITKTINVSWIAPNGKRYEDNINMSQIEYKNFVDNLLYLKRKNNK